MLRKLRIKPIYITLTIILVSNMNYLYLIDGYATKFLGVSMRDIALIGELAWAIYYLYKYRNRMAERQHFFWWMVGMIILTVTSSVQSWRLYGQPFLLGFAPQRYVIGGALLYFPLCKCLANGAITKNGLIHIVKTVGILQLLLFIGNYFADTPFLTVETGMRNNSIRYYFIPTLLILLFMICLDEVGDKGFEKVRSVIVIIAILYELMVVQQFRGVSMALVVSMGVYFLLVRERVDYKLLYLFVGLLALIILLNTDVITDVVHTVLSGQYDNGMLIRFRGKEFYMKFLMKHPILGAGNPSSFYPPALVATGYTRHIYLDDNGVVGFWFVYGGIGVIWFFSLWYKLIKNGWIIYKQRNILCYFLFMVYTVVISPNGYEWYVRFGFFVFAIYLALENQEMNDINKELEHRET